MNAKVLIFTLFIFCQGIIQGQEISKFNYSKIIVDGERIVLLDSIYIDTLIMMDESKLKFRNNCVVIVENAFIGSNCVLTSSGKIFNKWAGEAMSNHGKDLSIFIVFRSLGSLTIDTSGGDGADGRDGANGRNGTSESISMSNGGNGSAGQDGHNAGNGGDLKFHYLTNDFVLNFNQSAALARNSIFINVDGGTGGRGGTGGKGGKRGVAKRRRDYSQNEAGVSTTIGITGQEGIDGVDGLSGKDGKDGLLIIKKMYN